MVPLSVLGLGAGEIALLFLVILLIFGTNKLPNIGNSLGKGLKNFRKAVRGEDEEDEEKDQKAKELKEASKKAKNDE